MSKKLLLFLFEFGFLLKFQFFGTMSVSEIFLLLAGVPLISSLKPLKDPNLSLLSFLYLLLIFVQSLASAFHPNNSVSNDMKGIAVSVVGFLHVLFLYRNCREDLRLLGYAFAGYSAYFMAKWVLNERPIDPELIQLVFLKFYFVPALGAGLMLWLLYSIKSSRVKSFAYIFLGALFVTLGTRSAGSFFFLPGVFSLLIAKYNRLRNYKLFVPLIIVVGYVFYCFYTYLVLSGDITNGNTFQTLKLVNPYNPVNLLITGRTEIFAQWVAFTQKPLWGWGSWADDPNMYFHRLMTIIKDVEGKVVLDNEDSLPNHSVIVGAGMTHGVFALIAIFSIFILVMKRTFQSLNMNTRFVLPLLFVTVDFFWNMWFSPPSSFRYNIPMDMVLILLIFAETNKRKI
jgi:hypothetical protein